MQVLLVLSALALTITGLIMVINSPKAETQGRQNILWYIGWFVFALGALPLLLMLSATSIDLFRQAGHPTPTPAPPGIPAWLG